MKNIYTLLTLVLLSSCYVPNTLTSNIGGRTLSFSKEEYTLDSLKATVERRRTKQFYLYDSLVTDIKTAEVVFHRQITEDKGTIIDNVTAITRKKIPWKRE